MNPYLAELLERPAKLPTLPEVVRGIMESFGDENVSIEALSKQISLDPIIVAKLLRLANSAFYRSSRQILSVDECLLLLGMTTVRNVVLGCGLKDTFAPLPGIDLRALWNHSVQTACVARRLARTLGLNAELAFTVGLMQGIGQLMIHKREVERAAQISQVVDMLHPDRASIELRALHFHFGEVSAALARTWNLPESIAGTLEAVPLPLRADPANPIATCVHLASWVVWCTQALQAGKIASAQDASPTYPAQACALLGLDWLWWPSSLDGAAPAGLPPGRKERLPEVGAAIAGLEELLH